MTGWNMPPGCNVSDILGNSPADQATEALYEEIDRCLIGLQGDVEAAAEAIFKLCGLIYHDGYQAGAADEAMSREAP